MIDEKSSKSKDENYITIKKDALWKYSTFALIGLVLILAIFFVIPSKENTQNIGSTNPLPSAPQPSAVKVSVDDDPVLGEKNAPVTIIEFSDYQCPFCRKFWQDTLPSIEKDYISKGKVKLVYRDFPLGFHEGAVPYAEAANCARDKGGDEAYFKMHDKIFEEQNILDGGSVQSTVQYVGTDTLKKWAEDLGYDISLCMDSKKYVDEIEKDLSDGAASGVEGTPGFFINGKPLSGAQPYSVFKQMIDSELNN
ncbi:DsbA family protein [Candidatus Pacearchaeota archaeon]|nr:DsbA family protein [Candidatus Pacearchaeota archaeon]